MQEPVNHEALPSRAAAPKTPAFNIVIAYETLGAAIRVKEMADRLASDLRPACKLNCEFWRFDLLGHPSFSAKAISDARQADMVIIAARGDAEVAGDLKSWFESWIPRRRPGHSALVALLDEDSSTPGSPPALCNCLQQFAALGGMDFFCHARGSRPADLQYVFETVHPDSQVPASSLLENRSRRNTANQGRGINE